jgi:hypothetical protein
LRLGIKPHGRAEGSEEEIVGGHIHTEHRDKEVIRGKHIGSGGKARRNEPTRKT